jgi:hypothetical protein
MRTEAEITIMVEEFKKVKAEMKSDSVYTPISGILIMHPKEIHGYIRLLNWVLKIPLKEQISMETSVCVHPYAFIRGEEHGNPECIKCGKKLDE